MVTIVVLGHLIVSVLHGNAHTELGVDLLQWQQFYVIAVILITPLIALVLSWTRYVRAGLWLFFGSMLASLIFGASYHYIIISNDHVAHLPPGEARAMFRVTALLLLITETAGVILAMTAIRSFRKTG